MLSRDQELQTRLEQAPEWDLVVCDESHRMSAHYFGGELKPTKRYQMGQRVGNHARNLLLMTATPHNGKDEDFQLFMALLDEDRFAGKEKDSVHRSDPTDLMRRLVKEDLYTLEGKKLFQSAGLHRPVRAEPEREGAVRTGTEYVRDEMNRADRNAEARRRWQAPGERGLCLDDPAAPAGQLTVCDPPVHRTQTGTTGSPAQGRASANARPAGGDRLQVEQNLAALDLDESRTSRRGHRRRNRGHREQVHR